MDSKIYMVISFCLIGGILTGFFAGSFFLQNQIASYELGLKAKDAQIKQRDDQIIYLTTQLNSKESTIAQLRYNITLLEMQIQNLSKSAKVVIDVLVWGNDQEVSVVLKNTGTSPAVVSSLSIRENYAGSTFSVDISTRATGIVDNRAFFWTSINSVPQLILVKSHSYVLRVTLNNGYYCETIFTY